MSHHARSANTLLLKLPSGLEYSRPKTLPPELFILIVSHIRLASTLAKLCIVSSTFYAIAFPALYHNLRFVPTGGEGILNIATQTRFFGNQPSPSALSLISSLTLGLGGPSTGGQCTRCWPVVECSCDESRDIQFGETLASLTSLVNLQLVCNFCWSFGLDRHKYLLEHRPNTKPLKSFAFRCTCVKREESYIVDLLSSHRVSQVSALSINIDVRHPKAEHPLPRLETAVKEKSFLPNLRTLGHSGQWYLRILLKHRPIERLGLFGAQRSALLRDLLPISFPRNQERLACRKPTLTAVYTLRALECCRIIKENGTIFSELEEIGTFNCDGKEDPKILEHMEHLSLLKKLQVIHVYRRKNLSEHGDATDTLIPKIGNLIQSIKWIRVSRRAWKAGDPMPILWERHVREDLSTRWISHILPSPIHTHWDFARGLKEF